MRVVLDWDGTVTEVDMLDLVLGEFGDPEITARVEAELDAGTMTLNEVIAAEFAAVKAPVEEVSRWLLERVRVRLGFAELARAHRPLILSSGFHELIEPVLEREGVLDEVELRANRLDPREDGWITQFRVTEVCPHCGEPCKRRVLEDFLRIDRSTDREVVYAGDGYSDFCAVLAADRVFATGSLARRLDEQGVPYTSLTDFRALALDL